MSKILSVYVTTSSVDQAERIGASLVGERLAACANILPGVRSVYRWKGAIEHAEEVALIVKTRSDLFEAVTAHVTALHEADVPCIVGWPVEYAAEPYERWLLESLREA